MALNGNTLGDLIKTKMDQAVDSLSDPNNITESDRTILMRAIGNAIVDHIKANAVVSTTVSGTAPGPSFPSAVSGTGTGSIT